MSGLPGTVVAARLQVWLAGATVSANDTVRAARRRLRRLYSKTARSYGARSGPTRLTVTAGAYGRPR